MSFVDTDVIDRVMSEIVADAMERLTCDPNSDPDGVRREIRERVLEQWHRFRRFGVESRDQLAAINVRLKRRATRMGDEVDVSVDVHGTPLQRRKDPS